MADCETRPRAGDPPRLDEPIEILRELLQAERERLKIAQAIEKKRDIVFPETSMIVRDILRIMAAIEGRGLGEIGDSLDSLDLTELDL